jgi:hypothetical protein
VKHKKKFPILAIIVSVVILLVLILVGLYVYSISKISVENVRVNSLKEVSTSGFTLSGDIDLYNGGVLPVGIDHIIYTVVLEQGNKTLASGTIDGRTIPAGKVASFPFTNKISWVPTLDVAIGLITPGKTYAKVSGTVYVADLKVAEFKVPFEARIDLEEYIKQFAKENVQGLIDKAIDAVGNFLNKLG